MKLFLKIFGIVFFTEFVLLILSFFVLLQSNSSFMKSAGNIIIDLLSLPLLLLDRSYPYYAMEPGWVIAVMIISTFLLHAFIAYTVYKSVKKPMPK